jgi:hypothetical protein
MTEELPTEAFEQANATYLNRVEIQRGFLDKMRDPMIKLEDATWWWRRFEAAYKREIEAKEIADAERKAKMK